MTALSIADEVDGEKENFLQIATGHSVVNIGRAVKHIFPSVVHKKKRVNGKSVWIYEGLQKITRTINDTYKDKENTKSIALKFGWSPTADSESQNCSEFVLLECQETCNGQRVMKELKIFHGEEDSLYNPPKIRIIGNGS